MLANPSLQEIVENFKEKFKNELRKTDEKDFGTIFHVNRSRIRDIAIFFHEQGANFINIFVMDIGEKFEVTYEYFFKLLQNNKFLFISTEVDKKAEIDSIQLVYPQAKFIEDEITKRFRLNFSRFTEEVEELFVAPKTIYPADSELNITPNGIYNKIHLDNDYFNIRVEQDRIVAVAEKTGWLYRGIVPLLIHKNIFEDNLRITRKICYTSSYHHNLAYIMAIEQLLKIIVNDRIKLIRTLFCELERYENHLIWFANLLFLLGYKRNYFFLLKRRQQLQSIYRKYLKCNHPDELNHIGSIINIQKDDLTKIKQITEAILPMTYESIYYYSNKRYIKDRCEGIGNLEKEDCQDAGVTGPCLRASGINYDIRSDNSYLLYLDKSIVKEWDIVTFKDGDVFARVQTRLYEMKSSYSIINQVLQLLTENEENVEMIDLSKIKLAADEYSLIQLESPQGELIYYIRTADRPGKSLLGGIYIATPSLKNFLALNNFILNGNKESDFALIVHSMDLNFNEIDL